MSCVWKAAPVGLIRSYNYKIFLKQANGNIVIKTKFRHANFHADDGTSGDTKPCNCIETFQTFERQRC